MAAMEQRYTGAAISSAQHAGRETLISRDGLKPQRGVKNPRLFSLFLIQAKRFSAERVGPAENKVILGGSAMACETRLDSDSQSQPQCYFYFP